MTRRDQVAAVAQHAGITNAQARAALDAFSTVVMIGLLEDESIAIPDLGRFVVQRRAPRRVRNPATGVMMDLPANAVVSFKAAPELRDSVKERYA